MTDVSGLELALRPVLGQVTIDGMTRMPGGASRETWAFDALTGEGSRIALVLRRDPAGRPGEPGAMGREARAMAAARAAGLAVPEVLLCCEDPGPLGSAGMVMRRVAGQTIARRILRDDAYRQARRVLVSQVAGFAARLHGLNLAGAGLTGAGLADAGLAGLAAPDPLRDLAGLIEMSGQRSPVFEMAISALSDTRPPARAPVIVHGDLRLGNLIVGPEGLRAVIDWELVHAGDPAEDLGWFCVKAWRFGVEPPAAGLASREELLAAYRAAGGADIGLGELRWWEILGTLRWGLICMSQAQAHLSGAHRSVELAAIGRRVCEQEWDLLLLLDPDSAARAAAARPRPAADPRPAPAPHGRPTASELLDAVRGFLTEQVMPATGGQLSFHARVAANVLAIVARELDLGPLPDGPDLAAQVAAKLAVANPRYFAPAPPADGTPATSASG